MEKCCIWTWNERYWKMYLASDAHKHMHKWHENTDIPTAIEQHQTK